MDSVLRIAAIRQACHYLNVASLAVLVFDYLLTFQLEFDLVWKSRWTVGKTVFLLARYPTFVDVSLILYYSLNFGMSDKMCSLINSITSWSTAFGIGMAEIIMILRTYALYNNSRKMLICLVALYFAIFSPAAVILWKFLHSLKHGSPPLPIMQGCYPISHSRILIIDFILLILNESIIMVLTLWIGVKQYRHSRNRLIVGLYRDGIFYFVYIFMISGTYIVILAVGPPEYVDFLNTFQRVMHSVLSTRILLHMRDNVRLVEESRGKK